MNYPPNFDRDLVADNEPKNLHEEAGLVAIGLNEDGIMEYEGTDAQWKAYEELSDKENKF